MRSVFASARATSASPPGPVTVIPITTLWAAPVRPSASRWAPPCFAIWSGHGTGPTRSGADLPWDRLARLNLGTTERDAKRRAVRAFHSQIHPLGPDPEDAPILPPAVLRRFARDYEVYVVAPETL